MICLGRKRWQDGPVNATKHIVRSRVADVSQTLSAAFADDPVMRWIFEPEKSPGNTRFLAEFMRITCERSISIGHAYELADGAGAALWAPPDTTIFNEAAGIELYSVLCEAIGENRTETVLGGLREATAFHPEEPHFYLATIGIHPDSRGQGLGSTLMQRVLDVCDNEGLLAYLESSNPRNVSLYESAGFKVIAEAALPDGPIMRPMVRAPQG